MTSTPTAPPVQQVPNFGAVKWYNSQKGFGYITPKVPNAPDVYVQYQSILSEGFKGLQDGELVAFDFEKRTGGTYAVNVEGVGADGSTPLRDALRGAQLATAA